MKHILIQFLVGLISSIIGMALGAFLSWLFFHDDFFVGFMAGGFCQMGLEEYREYRKETRR